MIVNSTSDSGNASNVRDVNTAGQVNYNNAGNTIGGVLDC